MEIVHSDTSFYCKKTNNLQDGAISAELNDLLCIFCIVQCSEFCLNEKQDMEIVFRHSQICRFFFLLNDRLRVDYSVISSARGDRNPRELLAHISRSLHTHL